MGIKWRRSKKRSDEDADDDVKVEVDLLTGATRVDPHELLHSKRMHDLLNDPGIKRIDEQIQKRRADQP